MKAFAITDELLQEVRRLALEAAAEGCSLAVLPRTMLSLVEEVQRLRSLPWEACEWHCPPGCDGSPRTPRVD